MVEHFSNLASVELKVRVGEVAETDQTHENDQVRVISLALGLERIVSHLVTIRQIVNVVLLVPLVTVRVTREDLVMVVQGQFVVVSV